MNKNILITGANGQDAKILTNILSKKKLNLYLISNKIINTKKKRINCLPCDLKNKKKIKEILKQIGNVDVLVHLASHNPSYKKNNYKKHYLTNYNNTKRLIDCICEKNDNIKIIFSSSSRVFKKKEGIVNENSKFFVNDYYSKFRIEIDNYSKNLIKKFKQKKISFTNLILFNHDSIYRNQKFIIPRIIIAIKEKNINFLNNLVKEDIVMDFSHAEDICLGIEKIIFLKKNLKKIILSSGKSTKINDIIKFLIKKNKLNIKLNYKEKKNKCLIGDNIEVRNAKIINIKTNLKIKFNLLYNKNRSLEKKIKIEQIKREI